MNTSMGRGLMAAALVAGAVGMAAGADMYPPPGTVLPGTPADGQPFGIITITEMEPAPPGGEHFVVVLPFMIDIAGEGAGNVILVDPDPITGLFPSDPANRPDLWSDALIFQPGTNILDFYSDVEGEPFNPPLLYGLPTVFLDENVDPRLYTVYDSAGEPLGTYSISSDIPTPSIVAPAFLGGAALVLRRRRPSDD